MKIIIINIDTHKYFRAMGKNIEQANDWVDNYYDASLLEEELGFNTIKQLRNDGYNITFLAITDIKRYERLSEYQKTVKRLVKQEIKHKKSIIEIVEKRNSTPCG